MDFSFGIRGGGGAGFSSRNSHSSTEDFIIGDNTISTTMTVQPKFISATRESDGEVITSSLSIRSELNGSVYDIIVNTGVAMNNILIRAYGA
jgi:hypothetical protein